MENFLFFPNFFTMMQLDSKKTSNVKVLVLHEIYNFSSQSFFQKMLGYQDINLWIGVHELNNLVKICPSLGRFWPNFMDIFHLVPRGISKFISNMDYRSQSKLGIAIASGKFKEA